MEVHENVQPIIGQPGHFSHRLVLKTQKQSSLILPDKLQEITNNKVPLKPERKFYEKIKKKH